MDEVNILKEEKNNNSLNPIPPENHYQKNNDIVFLPSKFNNEAPTKFKILLFLIGFLGLQVVAVFVSLILAFVSRDEILTVALSNFLSYLITFVVLLIILGAYDGGKYLKIIFSGFKRKKTYIWAALMLGLALLIETILSLINEGILSSIKQSGSTTSLNEQTINSIFESSYAFLMILPVVIFAPFLEEFTYRLGLVDTIGKKSRVRGLILSSLIFGLLHFNGLTILLQMFLNSPDLQAIMAEMGVASEAVSMEALAYDLLVEVLNLPIYVFMGACLGLAYLITGDISTSIVAHATNNLLSTIISLMSQTYILPSFIVRLANLSISPYTSSFFSFIAR